MKKMNLKVFSPNSKYNSYIDKVGKIYNTLLLEKEAEAAKHKTKYKQNFATNELNQKRSTDI